MSDAPIAEPQDTRPLLAILAAELPSSSRIIREGGTSRVDQAQLRCAPEVLHRIVEAIPNTSEIFPTREKYLGVGYAIKAALGDTPAAYDLYWSWCARWPGGKDGPNDPGVVEADWRRMKAPFRRGWRYLAELAHRYSGGVFDLGEVWFEAPAEPLFPATDAECAKVRTYSFLTLREAADNALTSFARPLVKGLIHEGTMSVWYGPPKSYKTFVLLDIAYHIAAGRPWNDRKTSQGKIVYIIQEGGGGVRARAKALLDKYGDCESFILLPTRVDLFNPNADLQPLIMALRGLGSVVFVALDTLARAMAGGDENSTRDMGVMVAHADAVRVAVGCHFAIVHHTGKDESRGARGSNALLGALDTEVLIADGVIRVVNQRDFEVIAPIRFAIETANIGIDADGDSITSATIRVLECSEPSPKTVLTGGQAQVLAAMRQAAGDNVGRQLKQKEIAMQLTAMSSPLKPSGLRNQLRRLQKGGHVRGDQGFWAIQPTPAEYFEKPDSSFFD